MDAATAARRAALPDLAKYDIVEEIGRGGMATVYRAVDKRLGREVAVKVIHPHLRDSREVVSRFNNEARAVAKLRHPNIVEVFDVSEEDEPEQYLVAELVRGTTLRRLLQEHRVIPPEAASALVVELLGALAHAHASGVVHRDVKPENVLIDRKRPVAPSAVNYPPSGSTGDQAVVKLADFGIAKLLDTQSVTSTGQVLGSPAHMAPEQIEGGDVDARADVFGVGVLLYECMVGHLPFEGTNPAQVLRRVLEGNYADAASERATIGSQWAALIARALARRPDDRFPDATAMRDALLAELARLTITSPRRELESWLDAPQAYETAYPPRMIETLCALGGAERKRAEILIAAADYNRALAFAPNDPQLCRIVVGMNRAEARARFARHAVLALVLMLGLGVVAYGMGRLVRSKGASAVAPVPSVAEPYPTAAGAVLAWNSSAAPVTSASSDRPVRTDVGAREAGRTVGMPGNRWRTITLDLKPSMGVDVTIDGATSRKVTTGDTLSVDSKQHALTFACPVCTPVDYALAPGEKDDTIVIAVPIRPATLVIEGDLDKTYQIVEDPLVSIEAGTNTVALKSMFQLVTVQQMETRVQARVRLEAGKAVRVSF
ncbi:MAG: serine/threonine protein kinase [Myxococcota bacterium]|nr:serine/threonine protein kinase [Myxococcota bacterium]